MGRGLSYESKKISFTFFGSMIIFLGFSQISALVSISQVSARVIGWGGEAGPSHMVPRHIGGGGEELGSDRLRTEQLFCALAAGPAEKRGSPSTISNRSSRRSEHACRSGPAAAVKRP
jgi:hypothetical protein